MSRLLTYAALIVFGTGIALTSAAAAQQPVAAAPQPAIVMARSVVRPPTARLLAINRPGVPTIIQGNALNSTNGQLPNTIVRLRDKAKAELGSKFDLRQFDDAVVMGGNVPMDVLAKNVGEYIAKTKAT